MLAEGDVEQDGTSSVSADCAPPAASKVLPAVESRLVDDGGITVPGTSDNKP